MKNFIILAAILLTSCSKVYKEVWTVERVPCHWEEEIVIPGDHFHYKDTLNKWCCVYWEPDTFCWQHYDTMVVIKHEKTIRIK